MHLKRPLFPVVPRIFILSLFAVAVAFVSPLARRIMTVATAVKSGRVAYVSPSVQFLRRGSLLGLRRGLQFLGPSRIRPVSTFRPPSSSHFRRKGRSLVTVVSSSWMDPSDRRPMPKATTVIPLSKDEVDGDVGKDDDDNKNASTSLSLRDSVIPTPCSSPLPSNIPPFNPAAVPTATTPNAASHPHQVDLLSLSATAVASAVAASYHIRHYAHLRAASQSNYTETADDAMGSQYKSDGTIVTKADGAAQQCIVSMLRGCVVSPDWELEEKLETEEKVDTDAFASAATARAKLSIVGEEETQSDDFCAVPEGEFVVPEGLKDDVMEIVLDELTNAARRDAGTNLNARHESLHVNLAERNQNKIFQNLHGLMSSVTTSELRETGFHVDENRVTIFSTFRRILFVCIV
mmetsp:Transcript_29407/g.67639  ORF Transcript_29407/g.67639 Transcript_29407/m.67639 type:complete len:406 (-) Transcript_29407:1351-2568(-)